MIATYLVMKIALQAILEECNKMAALAEGRELAGNLKERIATLEIDFSKGAIDAETYEKRAAEILDELKRLSTGGLQPGGLADEL
jgi:hypothetical protein